MPFHYLTVQGRHANFLVGQACWGIANGGAKGIELQNATCVEGLNIRMLHPSSVDYGVWGIVLSSPSGVRGGAPEVYGLLRFELVCIVLKILI